MKQRDDAKPGHGRILEAWEPPDEAGEPLGCVATTFTFEPHFFEEECLARFLALETAPEDGAAYLIEREEKLAQLACAAVLVDQHHARGMRHLRWDLLAARIPGAILHAKVALLLWSRCARLIVASANLTETGYRRNHEVFGVLDYFEGSEAPLSVLEDIVGFLRRAVAFTAADPANPGPAVSRWNTFLEQVQNRCRRWGARQPPRGLSKTRVFAVTTGPDRPNAFRQLDRIWPASSPPAEAFVVSPFFDPPGIPNRPARELWGLLRRRGAPTVQFEVTAEDVPGGGLLLHAPDSLLKAQPRDGEAQTQFRRLKLEDNRPLHAKCLWLQNRDWVLYQMGSSNFTAAGLGLGKTPNLEANLVYAVSPARNRKAADALRHAWLESLEVKGKPRFLRQPLDNREDAPLAEDIVLPAAFGEAIFGSDKPGEARVELTFLKTPPAGWRVLLEDKDEVFYDEARWRKAGSPRSVQLPWPAQRPPSAFRVGWRGSKGFAWWPVNARDATSLPPPDELRELSLDDLIEILGSARPLHRVLRSFLKRRRMQDGNSPPPHLDPHKRVDTSSFLLQRTRRLSWALAALRERLSQPVPSREALEWRLRGHCGVMALVHAVLSEDRPAPEKAFLLTEIAVELARVVPQHAPGCLSRHAVRAALRECIREIQRRIQADGLRSVPPMKRYVNQAFREARV